MPTAWFKCCQKYRNPAHGMNCIKKEGQFKEGEKCPVCEHTGCDECRKFYPDQVDIDLVESDGEIKIES